MMRTDKPMLQVLLRTVPGWLGVLLLEQGIAQDFRPSQPWASPLRYNPALMAINQEVAVALHGRLQWMEIAKGYTTYQVHAMSPLVAIGTTNKLDGGLTVLYDQAGQFTTIDARIAIGYTMLLDRNQLFGISAALMGGYIQRTLGVQDLMFGDQFINGEPRPSIPTSEVISAERVQMPALGAGLLFFLGGQGGAGAHAGFFLDYVNSPNESFLGRVSPIPARATAHLSLELPFGDAGKVQLALYTWIHGGSTDLIFGGNFYYVLDGGSETLVQSRWAMGGVWYRPNRAFVFAMGIGYQWVSLTYTYDLPAGPFSATFGGVSTHEIALTVRLDRNLRFEYAGRDTPRY